MTPTTEEIAKRIKDPQAREQFLIMSQKKGIVERALERTFETESHIVVSDPVKKELHLFEKVKK